MTDDGQGQDERLAEIRALHFENADDPDVCYECGREWPCDEAYVVARLDALTAERDEWKAKAEQQAQLKADFRAAFQAAQQAGYDMEALRGRAEVERDDALARLAAAEAALERVEWKLDTAHLGLDREGPQYRKIIEAREIARAALAGSRERAAEGA